MGRGPRSSICSRRAPGPNRVTEIEAAVTKDGRILGAAARSARGLRRVPARADARAALSHARRGHRRLRHRQCRRGQPRRADQQDAGEPDPRLRRAAALSGAGAAGAADRDRARARSSRRDQAQSRPDGEVSVQGGRRLALRFRRLSARGRDRDRRGPARRSQAAAATRRARPAGKYGIGFAVVVEPAHVQHGLSLDAADARGARQGRAEERRDLDGDGQHRSARRGFGDRRRHRAGPGPRDGAVADRRRPARASRPTTST